MTWPWPQCQFSGCTEPVAYRVHWKGRPFRLCAKHGQAMHGIVVTFDPRILIGMSVST